MNFCLCRVVVSTCAVYSSTCTTYAETHLPKTPTVPTPVKKPEPLEKSKPIATPNKSSTKKLITKTHPKTNGNINVDGELLKNRTIWLTGSIDSKLEEKICTKLLVLEMLNPGTPIFIYISSSGGKVTSGFAIYDMIRYIQSPVIIVTLGHCSSMAAVILVGGDVRLSLPNNRLMVHSAHASVSKGTPENVLTSAAELQLKNEKIKEIMKTRSNISDTKCEELFIKDSYFWPEEALEFGMIDAIIEKVEDLPSIVFPFLKKYDRLKKKNVITSASTKAATTDKQINGEKSQNKREKQ